MIVIDGFIEPEPRPFEASMSDPILQVSEAEMLMPHGGEDPPAFAPYEASYFTSSDGSLISHDPHLNEDGEALYRFLLSQASIPPTLVLHCRGSHDEIHTRFVTHHRHDNHRETETEQYTEKVVDFDFKIDVGQHIIGGPTHWSIADSVPAYRGRMFHEVGVGNDRHRATGAESKAAKSWDDERSHRGFPPWISSGYTWRQDQPSVMHTDSVLQSSWTFRRWADDYCSSSKYFKEFDYEKVVYGWNFGAIVTATQALIKSTYYSGDIYVGFETSRSLISIRSENRLSRSLSNGWIKFFLIITFVYPFLWLFKHFHSRGGGIWKVCGGAYALKRTVKTAEQLIDIKRAERPLRGAPDFLEQYSESSHTQVATSVQGLREGVWFRQWEGTIRRAVHNRLRDTQALINPDLSSVPQAALLDGY
ncbi:hypothetical protein EDC04DRAFT_3050926, partial [Pisolithus marmoratus]